MCVLLGLCPQDATIPTIPYSLNWLICTTEINLYRQMSYLSLPKLSPVILTQTQTLKTVLFWAKFP